MISKFLANSFIKPHQSPVFDDPRDDYGLEYEDVSFQTADGVNLSGWLIDGGSDRVVIQSHFGVFCCRSGYTNRGKGMMKAYDGDIHFLRQAKYLSEAGYSVLMYDFRGHGNSDVGPNPWITWGMEEAKDVVAAVDFVSKHDKLRDASIGLLSICMGQGAATNAFALSPGLRDYANLKAMVSVQPLDYPHFVSRMGLPGFIRRGVAKVINKRTGIDFDQNTWRPNVKQISVPTLVIQNRNDPFLDEALVQEYCDNLQVEKEMHWIELPEKKSRMFNRLVAYDWVGENPDKILEWFGKYM